MMVATVMQMNHLMTFSAIGNAVMERSIQIAWLISH
jgi:hypothetical protein